METIPNIKDKKSAPKEEATDIIIAQQPVEQKIQQEEKSEKEKRSVFVIPTRVKNTAIAAKNASKRIAGKLLDAIVPKKVPEVVEDIGKVLNLALDVIFGLLFGTAKFAKGKIGPPAKRIIDTIRKKGKKGAGNEFGDPLTPEPNIAIVRPKPLLIEGKPQLPEVTLLYIGTPKDVAQSEELGKMLLAPEEKAGVYLLPTGKDAPTPGEEVLTEYIEKNGVLIYTEKDIQAFSAYLKGEIQKAEGFDKKWVEAEGFTPDFIEKTTEELQKEGKITEEQARTIKEGVATYKAANTAKEEPEQGVTIENITEKTSEKQKHQINSNVKKIVDKQQLPENTQAKQKKISGPSLI